MGRGYVTWRVLNFGGPIHISGMAEAIAVKFRTFQILPMGLRITTEKGVVWLTWPIATVYLENFHHVTLLTEINSDVDDGLLFLSPTVLSIH